MKRWDPAPLPLGRCWPLEIRPSPRVLSCQIWLFYRSNGTKVIKEICLKKMCPLASCLKVAQANRNRPLASEAICKWGGGAQCRREAPDENSLMCPPHFCAAHFSLVPPTWGGTTIVYYRLRDNWSGEVGRRAIKVMGPSTYSYHRCKKKRFLTFFYSGHVFYVFNVFYFANVFYF